MIIKNETVTVEINNFGAEVKSVLMNGVEYMWQADPTYWKRSSPVLFPIVGRLIDDEYLLNDDSYHMTQHGFARDNEFTLVASTETSALFLLKENKSTLKKYPFEFELYIGYELKNNGLTVSWKVINKSEETMYFQIGAHPAFNFQNGSVIKIDKTTNKYELQGHPYINAVINNVTVESIVVDDSTFLNDAIVLENIKNITLSDSTKSIEIQCEGFPYLGIWSSVKDGKNAPFICLEPWHGITDFVKHDKNFTKKTGIKTLESKEVFEASYKIIVY